MKFKNVTYLLILITLILTTCIKPEKEMIVKTGIVKSRTYNSASVSGILVDIGRGVTGYGHCYAKTPNVSITNSATNLGNPDNAGDYISLLTDLDSGAIYYVKSYITNNEEIVYGEEIAFETISETVTDIDGNIYNVAEIGNQIWLKENLKTTRYNNGTAIPLFTDNSIWSGLNTPAYCWYDNYPTTYKSNYGALYNWHAVNTGKLCPTGWHVPSSAEWTSLITYLGGESIKKGDFEETFNIAGGKLKEEGYSHWANPNTGATNESGFSALPGGDREFEHGIFQNLGSYGAFWSSTRVGINYFDGWFFWMSNGNSNITRYSGHIRAGFSVRCIKD